MSNPNAYFVELEYEYENKIVKKSLQYSGNENIIVRQVTGDEEISIRIPRLIMLQFMRMTDV